MDRSNQATVEQTERIGADFLQLDVNAARLAGLADWLTTQLRAAISTGVLPVSSRFPATRVLATELRISRGVVTEAYQRLSGERLVIGRGRAGTTVATAPRAGPFSTRQHQVAPVIPAALLTTHVDADPVDMLRAATAEIDLAPGRARPIGVSPRWLGLRRACRADRALRRRPGLPRPARHTCPTRGDFGLAGPLPRY